MSHRFLLRVAAIVSATVLVSSIACGRSTLGPPRVETGALRNANVLLVTIDTLRADRIGAYGSTRGLTPTLDRLAKEGVRFETVHAHVPLTLPSHATIMTGQYPTANGVRDNGSFRLDGSHPTLARLLAGAGYSTAAFVGAFVLDARFGLNDGFASYDDRMRGSSAMLDVVERSAEEVLAPAEMWIARAVDDGSGHRHTPWFAWIHLYDPHEPYRPPEPFASRYRDDPYDGEVAYADAALGAVLDRLRATKALDRTLVVVASDHGESLGEHGERTHGLFAYESTLRVPLILWAPEALRPAVVDRPARLVDILPTIVDLVGVPPPDRIDGRSLRPALNGERSAEDDTSYFEALNANLTRGWAPLKGVVSGEFKLVDLPQSELYDLAADPHETHNLYAARQPTARDLESRLDRLGTQQAPLAPQPVDPDAAARLRSLGYVVGVAAKPTRAYTAADDPKRLVHLNAALDEAASLWAQQDAARAIKTLQAVIAERPDLIVAYERLAFVLQATGRSGEAIALLDRAARDGHADRSLLRLLGAALRDAGDPARAVTVLEPLAHQDPHDLETLDALAQAYARSGRTREAEAAFLQVLAASPNAAATWTNLGALRLMQDKTDAARDALEHAIAINPDLATAHNALGVAYARLGQQERAIGEWRRALTLRPDLADARANLEQVGAR